RRAAPGPTVGERASRAALPADEPLRAGNRGGAVRFAEHDQGPPAPHIRQARRAQPHGGGQPGARARLAIALLAQTLIRTAVSRLMDRTYTVAADCSWSGRRLIGPRSGGAARPSACGRARTANSDGRAETASSV